MLLIACPKCARQYDVTGLDPGSQVRCYCEELFVVQWPVKLAAGALTCTNCGGAVSVSDEACAYCQARISEADRRKTTLCPACFTRIEDDSKHCRACSLPIKPQALAPLPVERDCPRCASKLRVRSLEVADVTECCKCLGMWLSPDTFRVVTSNAQRGAAGNLQFAGQKQRTSLVERGLETVKYIPCLTCGELMQRRQYQWAERSTGVVIDVCRGHGLWLDHDELERIVEHIAASPAPDASAAPAAQDPVIVTRAGQSPILVGRDGSVHDLGRAAPGDWLTDFLRSLADVFL